jgi:hypothetical protein
MKVELHLHTTRRSACATSGPEELLRAAANLGYEAVYLTEHHDVWPAAEIAELQAAVPAVRIFPGVELNLTFEPLQHLLVLGTSDPEYLTIFNPGKVLAKARAEGHLTILAHPCRWEGGGQILDQGLLPDAIEFRTGNQGLSQSAKAEQRAEQLHLPLVNAGDTHSVAMLGHFWIETARPIVQADDIRTIILAGQYANRTPGDPLFYRPGFTHGLGRVP